MTFDELKERLAQRREILARFTDLSHPTPFWKPEVEQALADPAVLQPAECRETLSAWVEAEGPICMNAGAGSFATVEEGVCWLNVDARPLGGIDLCIDLFDLPLWVPQESCRRIFNKDVIEHFGWSDEADRLLRIWWALLVSGGELEVITPDLRTVIHRYLDRNDTGCNHLWAMYHLYGKQTYSYNYHKSLFDFASLSTHMKSEGFKDVKHLPNMGNHLHVIGTK